MHANILHLADKLRGSYWFIPSLMALFAVLLAGGMIWLDSYEGSAWMDRLAWLYASRPSGARQVLSSIGGSMITVAGTVFSVTIAAVVYASGQYGPRLLSNFMSDRGNQVTLGTFIATFLYCLVVLRTVRSAEEAGAGFVPNLALLVGVLLAVCSIAVLIFFIHHVPSKIHINSVIKDIGDRLLREIDNRFPSFIGSAPDEDADAEDAIDLPPEFRKGATEEQASKRRLIAAKGTGYIEVIDDDLLLSSAKESNVVLRLQYQPGDFVHAGRTLVEAAPAEAWDEDTANRIRSAFSIGSRRSALQDLRFLIDELVEIAARALSPGVNDPFTAVTCLDWLASALAMLAPRQPPSPLRLDDEGRLRVIAHPVTFDTLAERSFGALLQYCATDMIASLHYIRALGEISLECSRRERIVTIKRYLERLEQLAEERLSGYNLSRVKERAATLRQALAQPDYRRHLRDSNAWLGGSA